MTLPAVGASVCASGQPGVKGEQRHFNGEAQEESHEEELLLLQRQVEGEEIEQIKRAPAALLQMQDVQGQNRHQHQGAAGHGVKDEFHRGVQTVFAAPHADHQVHGNQHRFPENEEQEEVERHEGAQHAGFEDQHEDHEFLHLGVDALPGAQQRNRRQQRRQHEQRQADAVDADVIGDAQPADPGRLLAELHARQAAVKRRVKRHRDDERHQHDAQRPAPHQRLAPARQRQQHDGAQQGQEHDGTEKRPSHTETLIG